MLKILEEMGTDNSKTLHLDGSLVSEWIGILRSSCDQVFREDGRLILNLAGLSFSDHEGIKLLQHLQQQQVAFINCSPFLREQLKQQITGSLPTGSTCE
jgi:ABC-type transporter Mla MlaB component